MDDPSQLEARRRKVLDNAEARLRFIKEGTPWRNNDVQNTDASFHEGDLGSNKELHPKQDDSKCVNIEESQGPSNTSNVPQNDEPVQNRLSEAESKSSYMDPNSEQTDKCNRTDTFIQEEVNYLPDIKRVQEDIDKNFVKPNVLSQALEHKKHTDEVFNNLTFLKLPSESNEPGHLPDSLSQASKDNKVTEVVLKAINLLNSPSESNESRSQSDPLSQASEHKQYTDGIYKAINFLNQNLPSDSIDPGLHSEMLSQASKLKKHTDEAFKTSNILNLPSESNEPVSQSNPVSQAPKHKRHTDEVFKTTILKLPSGSNESETLRTFKTLLSESSHERQERKRRAQELNKRISLSFFVMFFLGVLVRISYTMGLSWFFGEIMLVPFVTAAIPSLISLLREPPAPSGAIVQLLIMAGIKASVLRRAFTATITFRSFVQFFSVYLIAFIFTHQLAEYMGNLVKIHL